MDSNTGIDLDLGVRPTPDRLRRILQGGIEAPSAENRHYLRFESAPEGVRLLSTDISSWSEQPHRRMLALVSYGAVIENMSLRAAASGFSQATQWFPDPARPELIADCRWAATTPSVDPLEAAIERRHTNRRFYRREPVSAAALERVCAAAEVVPGARLLWFDEPSARAAALQTIRLAETERFRREALHRELFGAIRFELGWQQTADEGLPPGALEVEPPMRAAFAALRRWPLMRALTRLGVHHALGVRAGYLPCKLAPHLGLVLCDAPNVSLRATGAGRALQRAWLAASADDLAFQPMAAAVALVHQRPGDGWVSAPVQALLRDRLAQLTSGRAECAWMFIRMGHARSPSVATGRPPLDAFLTTSAAAEGS